MDKNEYFKEVTNCPKFKALNTRLNKKPENIFLMQLGIYIYVLLI